MNTTEIYNNTNRWTAKKANEYLQALLQENGIEGKWKFEDYAAVYKTPWYMIILYEQFDRKCAVDCGRRAIKSIMHDMHYNQDRYLSSIRKALEMVNQKH